MLISELMDTVINARSAIMAAILGVDPSSLSRKQDAESWSALQVLDHVQQVEQNVASLLDRLSTRAIGRNRLPFSAMTEVPVNTTYSEIIPRYNSIPAFPETEPTVDRSLPEIESRLEDSRRLLLEMAAIGRDHDCTKLIAPHSALGRMNYYEWIYLIPEHDRLHTEQIMLTAGGSGPL